VSRRAGCVDFALRLEERNLHAFADQAIAATDATGRADDAYPHRHANRRSVRTWCPPGSGTLAGRPLRVVLGEQHITSRDDEEREQRPDATRSRSPAPC